MTKQWWFLSSRTLAYTGESASVHMLAFMYSLCIELPFVVRLRARLMCRSRDTLLPIASAP